MLFRSEPGQPEQRGRVVARAYSGHDTPALFWLAGLTAGVVGAVVAGAAAPLRDETEG